jgi:hypothetical protein
MKIRHGPFGEVIGRRRLQVMGARRQVVTVSLGKPRRTQGTLDWECPFRISGAGVNLVEYGYGIDSMQALATALEGIRYMLDKTGKPLSWAEMDGETGFQRWIPFWGDSVERRRLERLIEREMRSYVKRLKERRKKRRGGP